MHCAPIPLEAAVTLRRSLTLTAVLLALLFAAYTGALEPAAEWVAEQIHLPYTRY